MQGKVVEYTGGSLDDAAGTDQLTLFPEKRTVATRVTLYLVGRNMWVRLFENRS
jgi:hypothetical protein